MKLSLIQMDIILGEVDANRAKACALIEQGLEQGAELIVLPELWTTGYKLGEIDKLAEPEDGPTLQMLARIAKDNGVEIITGSIPEKRGGKVYNTAYALNRSGDIVGRYSKIHLIGLMDEEKYISPGGRQALFDMSFGLSGLIICYDLRFTELPRALALKGCQTLFVPAEWPTVRGEHWLALNIARAIENQMFVIAVNRVGSDENNVFFGNSLIVNPWGEILARGSENAEEVITAEVDFTTVGEVRRRIPVFADRRPECY